jgi:membrane fusion protein, multidrug efflux system
VLGREERFEVSSRVIVLQCIARISASEGGRDSLSLIFNVAGSRANACRSTPRPKTGGGRGSVLPALCGLTLAGVLAAGCQRETPATAAAQKPATTAPAAPAARGVRVAPATEVTVARTVTATGTLAADEQMVLGAKVVGRLSEITVDLGSPVRKGQPVARIDPTDYRHRLDQAIAALQQARARLGMTPDGTDDRVDPVETAVVRQAKAVLDEARLNRDRTAQLWKQELVARSQVDSAVAAYEVAEGRYQDAIEEVHNRRAVLAQRRSEVDLARQQLADTVLTSPIDGAVAQRQASIGEYLAAGAPVVTLVRLHPLRLRFSVPEREATSVRVGQQVRIGVEGDATAYPGTVARLSPAITEQNRTLMIEAEVPNRPAVLRPGAFAKAEVVIREDDRVVTVPTTAIVTFAGVEKVFSVREGKSAELRVTTGRRLGDRVEILTGLKAGEPVVVQPGNLTGGLPVTVEK